MQQKVFQFFFSQGAGTSENSKEKELQRPGES